MKKILSEKSRARSMKHRISTKLNEISDLLNIIISYSAEVDHNIFTTRHIYE